MLVLSPSQCRHASCIRPNCERPRVPQFGPDSPSSFCSASNQVTSSQLSSSRLLFKFCCIKSFSLPHRTLIKASLCSQGRVIDSKQKFLSRVLRGVGDTLNCWGVLYFLSNTTYAESSYLNHCRIPPHCPPHSDVHDLKPVDDVKSGFTMGTTIRVRVLISKAHLRSVKYSQFAHLFKR